MESRVTLTFLLKENKDPDFFASKVALACALHGAIQEGEGIEGESVEVRWYGYEHFVPKPYRGRIFKMPRLWQSHKQSPQQSTEQSAV